MLTRRQLFSDSAVIFKCDQTKDFLTVYELDLNLIKQRVSLIYFHMIPIQLNNVPCKLIK